MDDFFQPIGSTAFAVNQGFDTVSGLQFNFTGGKPLISNTNMLDFSDASVIYLVGGVALQGVGAALTVTGNPLIGLPVVGAGVAVQAATMYPQDHYSPAGQAVIDGFHGATMGPGAAFGEPIYPYQADPVVTDWTFNAG